MTEADFDADVIERSHEIPVLVDFWAPWCGPCRTLGPVLEQLTEQMPGRFELVKINTDENQTLAMRYHIRSIPAVKLFHRGSVVTEFVGALPGGSIRKLLEQHLPNATDDAVGDAVRLAESDRAAARAALARIVADAPDQTSARIELARLALRDGDADEVERVLADVDPSDAHADLAERLLRASPLARDCAHAGGEAKARARVEASPDDLDALYELGCCLAIASRWEAALEQLLEVVKRKASHRDGAARRAMIAIFGLMPHDDVRDHYQRKLQIYA